MNVSKEQQRRIAIILGVAVTAFLLYRWWAGRQVSSGTAATGQVAGDAAASDFASLAGQEQSDVAALQAQNSDLLGQEQSDVAGLQGLIGANAAQEQADISGLTGAIAGFSNSVAALAANQTTLSHDISQVALGITRIDRNATATVKTHQGGHFYAYYKRVTGHAPPARIRVNNTVYRAWKDGIKASAIQAHPPHKSAPKNHQVAHPNPDHKPQTHVNHPGTPAKSNKPASRPVPKPAPAKKAPAKAKPKPKASGRRK